MLRRLEMALAVDKHRSFHRAARTLRISQPTLTRSIQVLEKELGVRLFDRTKQGLELTEYGRVVLRRTPGILREVQELKHDISLMKGLEVGELAIGSGSIGMIWISRAVGQLVGGHPGLKVRNLELPWWELPEALLRREIDIAVGESSVFATATEIAVDRLSPRQMVMLCRAGHPLAGASHVSLADIARYPLAAPRLPPRIFQKLPTGTPMGSVSTDGRYFSPRIECATWYAIIEAVTLSDAIGAGAPSFLASLAEQAGIAILPFRPVWWSTDYAVARLRDWAPSPAAEAFYTLARAAEASIMGGARPSTERHDVTPVHPRIAARAQIRRPA
jgi:DNA-binding transcriptional LysR family regulator